MYVWVNYIGDKEGLCGGVGVEEMDVEIGGRSDDERCVLCSVRESKRE